MSWKRLLALLAVAALVAFAVACGDDDEDVPGDDGDASATNTPVVTTAATAVTDAPTQPSNCPEPSGDAPEPDVTKQYPTAPEMTIDPAKEYLATLHTVRGDFTIKLRPDLAPQHVNSFVFLARDGYYDGVTFHRVLEGFMAQTGDPTGTGSGGPGYTIPAEFTNDVSYMRGTLGMARTSDPNSGGSQFFITFGDTPSLNGAYTIFGEVIEGMEVVDCITRRDPQTNPAFVGDAIISIDIADN